MQLTICSRVLAALCFFFYCSSVYAQSDTYTTSGGQTYQRPTADCVATTYIGTESFAMGSGNTANTAGYNQNQRKCVTLDLGDENFKQAVTTDIPLDDNGNPVAAETDDGQAIVFSDNYLTNKIITASFAINTALQAAGVGVEIRGLRYEWEVKKPDASSELQLSVKLFTSDDFAIYSKNYNYAGQQFTDWTAFTEDRPPGIAFISGDAWTIESKMTGNGAGSGVRGLKYTISYAPVVGHEDDFSETYNYGMTPFENQCAADPMSDQQCTGYQAAYTTQQCQADALYDATCDGYAAAYTSQQCTADATYDTTCPGYQAAYTTQQCNLDQTYDTSCPYYAETQVKKSNPGMNVSGAGSDYIFIFRGNNPGVFETLKANLANLQSWMWECTSGAQCGDNQVGYISAVTMPSDDHIFLYTSNAAGDVIAPASGRYYEFLEIDTACAGDATYTSRCGGFSEAVAEAQFDQDCNVNPQSNSMCNGYMEMTEVFDYGHDDGQIDGQMGLNEGEFRDLEIFNGSNDSGSTGIDIQATTGIDLESSTGIDQESITGIDQEMATGVPDMDGMPPELDYSIIMELMGPDELGELFDVEEFTGQSQEEITGIIEEQFNERPEMEVFTEESLFEAFEEAFEDSFVEEQFEDAFIDETFEEPIMEDSFTEEAFTESFEEPALEEILAIEEVIEEAIMMEEAAIMQEEIAAAIEEDIQMEEAATEIREIALEEEEALEEINEVEEISVETSVATPNAPTSGRTTSIKKRAITIATAATTAAENTASSQAQDSASNSNDNGGTSNTSGGSSSTNSNGGSNNGNDSGSANSGSNMGSNNGSGFSGNDSSSGSGNSSGSSSGSADFGGNSGSSNFSTGSSGGFNSQNFASATGQPNLQTGDAGIGAMTGGADSNALTSSGLSTSELTGEVDNGSLGQSTYTFGTIDAGLANDISSIIAAELNELITTITKRTLEEANQMGEPLEEVSEDDLKAQQELEDDLVEKAIAGDDSEDAQAALLGYNPNFRAYVQPQMSTNTDWYGSDGIYTDQQNYDNPSSRFFSGASDETHQAMVRQQYERK